jgi:hypothetical protein
MNLNTLPLLAILFLLTACYSNVNKTKDNHSAKNQTNTPSYIDTRYMSTGFYFLAEKGKGVNMRRERSDEIYTISPLPFASVENLSKTELKKKHLKDGDYTELCMMFNNKGTKDLAEGTGNPLHPNIAIIIANKLLYVVENTTSIKTGVMCVGLVGYSEQEMKKMKISADNKR